MAEVVARCERCKRAAPTPTSAETKTWGIITLKQAGREALVCSECLTPEGQQQLEDQARREALGTIPSYDAIVFPNGQAKPFGDCTGDDLGALARQAEEAAAEALANAKWLGEVAEAKERS